MSMSKTSISTVAATFLDVTTLSTAHHPMDPPIPHVPIEWVVSFAIADLLQQLTITVCIFTNWNITVIKTFEFNSRSRPGN